MDNTCCKCGKELNGCINFTTEGDMCSKCFGKYIVREIRLKKKQKQPIKTEYPMSRELRKKGI